jgi:hypothetical protein
LYIHAGIKRKAKFDTLEKYQLETKTIYKVLPSTFISAPLKMFIDLINPAAERTNKHHSLNEKKSSVDVLLF